VDSDVEQQSLQAIVQAILGLACCIAVVFGWQSSMTIPLCFNPAMALDDANNILYAYANGSMFLKYFSVVYSGNCVDFYILVKWLVSIINDAGTRMLSAWDNYHAGRNHWALFELWSRQSPWAVVVIYSPSASWGNLI
jgi:hypothetical protein